MLSASRWLCPNNQIRQKPRPPTAATAKLAPRAVVHGLGHLAGLGFGALFQRGFARQLHSSFVIDADAFYPNDVADLRHVFRSFYPEIGQLGNVHQSIFARENFDECPKFLGRNNAALIGGTDLDLLGHAADDFLGPRHRFAAGRVDVHRAIVFDVNFGAGLGHDAFDRFAARPDERANFLGINFDRLDPGRVFRKFGARFVDCAAHDLENFAARFLCTLDRFTKDFQTDSRQFQIELVTGHALGCSAEFEIHVTEMILRPDDIG